MLRVGDAILDKTHTPYVVYDFFSWSSRLEEDEAAEDKAVLIDKVPTPENPNPQPQAPKPKPERETIQSERKIRTYEPHPLKPYNQSQNPTPETLNTNP